jgi:hypothetical protein
MLIPAGVVDFLFKFRIYFLKDMFKGLKNNGSFYLNSIWSNRFFMSIKVKINQLINHPGREIETCIYMLINRAVHPSFKRRGNFFIQFLIRTQSLA